VRYLMPLLSLLLITGCGYKRLSQNDTKEIATSNANVEVIAKNLERDKRTQPHASILTDQVKVSNTALNLTEEQQAELGIDPTVDEQRLAENPEAEAERSKRDTKERLEGIEEDHASGFWGWSTGGGIVTGLMAALGIASKLGLPGAGIAHSIGRMIAPKLVKEGEEKAAKLEERVSIASEAIVSSDIGRWGLRELDKKLPDDVRDRIGSVVGTLTKGHAITLDGLFVYLAKNHAIDAGKHGSIDSMLNELRGLLPTEGGIPLALDALINREG